VATLEDQLRLTYNSIMPLPARLEQVEKKLMGACASW
jgi:hypothetical protein